MLLTSSKRGDIPLADMHDIAMCYRLDMVRPFLNPTYSRNLVHQAVLFLFLFLGIARLNSGMFFYKTVLLYFSGLMPKICWNF